MTKVEQEHHGSRAGQGEQDGIDQGRDERLLELLGLLEQLGEPLERGLEHASLFARPHHVDGQA